MHIHRQILNPTALRALASALRAEWPHHRTPRQTGMRLAMSAHDTLLRKVLAPLEAIVPHLRMRLDCSSFRLQMPGNAGAGAFGALSVHQDWVALDQSGGLSFPRSLSALRGRTFWVPLCDIDEDTPGLVVGPTLGVPLTHVGDSAGYAVLPPWAARYIDTHLMPVTMRLGDAVELRPTTLHATHMPLQAKRERMSLDVRFLPG
jgi:ectoine hydroxylase-related dioxygenase (phytanoyl-CoA dioxygenase family)